MQAIHQFAMGRYVLYINHWWIVEWLIFRSGFAWKLRAKHMKNYVTFSEVVPGSPVAVAVNYLRSRTWIWHSHSLRILWDFAVFQNSPRSVANSLRFPDFPWKGHLHESLKCVGTRANSSGRYSIYLSDVRGIVAPSPAICGVTMRSRWPTRRRQ